MEVTNVSDKITHAIIGGGNVDEFGISQDAELFHILSSALYSRKKEAAVREVLCNAWDSHVDSNITDIPLEITLTSEKLSIRDFGKGLLPEQIKPIYGTYGKSTKQHDGKQTGGFGLGSKAPFAYVDHFEVISCCDGIKTIYKMSQSNAEVGGKPSISTIVSVPTDESGMQVTINLKDPYDKNEFSTLIHHLVRMGGMNATLNGNVLPKVPFEEAKDGFMFLNKDMQGHHLRDPIFIRYGHVVYPLKPDIRFESLYERATDLLKLISTPTNYTNNHASREWMLVLQADPHSISVTPSREDLSMTDKTVETVTNLLQKFLAHADGLMEKTVTEMVEDAVDKVWLAGTPDILFNEQNSVPLANRVSLPNIDYACDFDTISRRYVTRTYPKFKNFRAKDLGFRVNSLIKAGFGNRGLLQSFRNEVLKDRVAPKIWFQRRLVQMTLRNSNPKVIDPERFYVYTIVNKGRYQSQKEPGFVPVNKWLPYSTEQLFPLLRGVVILTYSRTPYNMDRADSFPVMAHWLGNPVGSLCYAVQRKAEKAKEAREFFESKGFTVLDLTVAQPWEAKEIVEPVRRADPKPRKKGIVCLSAGLVKDQGKTLGFETQKLFREDAPRIENPAFVVKISAQSNNASCFPDVYRLNSERSLAVVRKYGHLGGVVQNSAQERKLIDQGAEEFSSWIYQKVFEEYTNNPAIKEYYTFSVGHRDIFVRYHDKDLYKIIRSDAKLKKLFGFPNEISEENMDTIKIYEGFNPYNVRNTPLLAKIDALIQTWKLDPKAEMLCNKIKESKLIGLIDSSILESILKNLHQRFTPAHQKSARKILLTLLEG